MRRTALLSAILLLGGCAALNDSLVRMWFQDQGLSDRINTQIREGLERRRSAPEQNVPRQPAPVFIDQG